MVPTSHPYQPTGCRATCGIVPSYTRKKDHMSCRSDHTTSRFPSMRRARVSAPRTVPRTSRAHGNTRGSRHTWILRVPNGHANTSRAPSLTLAHCNCALRTHPHDIHPSTVHESRCGAHARCVHRPARARRRRRARQPAAAWTQRPDLPSSVSVVASHWSKMFSNMSNMSDI
jgi:hypothetical protein